MKISLIAAVSPDLVIGRNGEAADFVGGLHPAILMMPSPTMSPVMPSASDRIA